MSSPAWRVGANAELTISGLKFTFGDGDYFALFDSDQVIDISDPKCESKVYPSPPMHQQWVRIHMFVQSIQV